jgi:hypothetical protein
MSFHQRFQFYSVEIVLTSQIWTLHSRMTRDHFHGT